MYKLSQGDLAVNQSASTDQYAGLSREDIEKNKFIFFRSADDSAPTDDIKIKQPDVQVKPDNAKNVIPIQYNTD